LLSDSSSSGIKGALLGRLDADIRSIHETSCLSIRAYESEHESWHELSREYNQSESKHEVESTRASIRQSDNEFS
jgi:hypothetical protein